MPIFFPKIKLIFLWSFLSERLSKHSKLSYLGYIKSLCNPEETKALTSSDCLAGRLVRELHSAETCRWIRYCRACEWHSLQKQNFVGSENSYKIHEKQLKHQGTTIWYGFCSGGEIESYGVFFSTKKCALYFKKNAILLY